MIDKDRNQISRPHWYSLGLPPSLQTSVWISIILVYVLSILDLTGWVFNITFFKSIEPQWAPMKVIVALSFIFSASALVMIQVNTTTILRYWVSKTLSIIIFVISLATIIYCLSVLIKGHESTIAGIPLLSFFLSPVNRMPILTAVIFLLTGCILFLFSIKNKLASEIGHFLIFPAALGSYFVPISYILNVYSMTGLSDIQIALNTGISFCALCIAILFVRPDTWLMKVFTSDNMGGMMARRLLPGLLLLPLLIGWFRIRGERAEIFKSEVGVALVALTYTGCFVWLIWRTARSVNQIDEKRHISDEELKKSYSELDMRVKERTAELSDLNRKLDAEIIQRRKAQEAVLAEHRRFTELLELMPAYLILLTPDYHVSYANRYFRERFGEDHGMRCYEYLFDRTEPCEVCNTYNVLKDNRPHTWEWKGPDGRNYSISDFPFTDNDGSPLIMEMGIDVTDLKQAEANLQNLNAELEQKVNERTRDIESANYRLHQELTDRILAEEALKNSESQLKELNATKDKFFNIVAHDLKNPFTSLIGSSELLFRNIDQMDNEKIKALALILNDASKNGYAILQNLLDWSRSQTGLLKLNPERINLRNLLDEHILNLEQISYNKEIKIHSEVTDDLSIYSDKNMIKTIMRNLLSNAIKYSYRSGKVIVSAAVNDREVIISVKDNGIGIPEENIKKIFRIDAKYSVPGTENEQGTGLGLKLCKEFVEKLGGKIWVESVDHKGSEFKFSIPVKEV
jgi:two-component system sensor histidine kinase/response regulator